ncbi:hypothetical protein EJ03DRAFT_68219 [Teratosphaeria nubilosa]|uniref:Uncharacterized protein n=1 Tax=Teratosphaeria nubilosa TaxID=161662 RepID=A0A6G1KT82_9PEZI|nr:hypothetical protein EJ03DRAFT_68219 [Teratosphaeria nubilosa]
MFAGAAAIAVLGLYAAVPNTAWISMHDYSHVLLSTTRVQRAESDNSPPAGLAKILGPSPCASVCRKVQALCVPLGRGSTFLDALSTTPCSLHNSWPLPACLPAYDRFLDSANDPPSDAAGVCDDIVLAVQVLRLSGVCFYLPIHIIHPASIILLRTLPRPAAWHRRRHPTIDSQQEHSGLIVESCPASFPAASHQCAIRRPSTFCT